MSDTKIWYRPGLVFYSPFSGYQVICRPHTRQFTVTGEVLSESRGLEADFATHAGEYSYTSSDGSTQTAADIRGHFFDLDSQAEQKGWTEAERETVARKLLMEIVPKFPSEIRLHTEAPVGKPWPKYDETHHSQIPVLADQLGLVAESLTYEKQNKNRESVVAKLNELLAVPPSVEELAAA